MNGFRLMQTLRQQGVVSPVEIEQALLICWDVPAIAKQLAVLPALPEMADASMTQAVPSWEQPWVAPPLPASIQVNCRDCGDAFTTSPHHRTVCPTCRSAINTHSAAVLRFGRDRATVAA